MSTGGLVGEHLSLSTRIMSAREHIAPVSSVSTHEHYKITIMSSARFNGLWGLGRVCQYPYKVRSAERLGSLAAELVALRLERRQRVLFCFAVLLPLAQPTPYFTKRPLHYNSTSAVYTP